MSEPTKQSLVPWSHVDAQNLDTFLNSDTGRKLLPKVAESAPQLLESGDTNAILIRNGKFKGFQEALNEIFYLAHPVADPEGKPAGHWPDLTDDKAWNDGQKIDPSKPI